MELTNQDLVARIARWQESDFVHELTCGIDAEHGPLTPTMKLTAAGVFVVLECDTCDHEQTHIPDVFFRRDYDVFMDAMETRMKAQENGGA